MEAKQTDLKAAYSSTEEKISGMQATLENLAADQGSKFATLLEAFNKIQQEFKDDPVLITKLIEFMDSHKATSKVLSGLPDLFKGVDFQAIQSQQASRLIIGGDLNGHIGATADGYAGVHGGFGFGVRNDEGRSILEFATTHDLVVANSFFKKRDVNLITFQSGGHNTQIDYLLVRKSDLRACRDCRVFPGEACSSQHKLLALDTLFERLRPRRVANGLPRILWKNLNGEAAESFRVNVLEGLSTQSEDLTARDADQMWNSIIDIIKEAAKDSLGVASGASRSQLHNRESWWFCEDVQAKVAAKQSSGIDPTVYSSFFFLAAIHLLTHPKSITDQTVRAPTTN
ncbi:hypothetical protein CTI12_AA378710 [Artemisia annua]|uniref:Uncharacterized protein n=1 Tax=Artemisia annua TaxID=35608 RepID=A0A2U1MHZ1_ARTAN|nr:hypothetical protein CTI12_AA378710 [Artemisia annua]